MKLTTIFFFIGLIQVSASGLAQQVTLNMKNTSLKDVFFEINKQTGYNFSWASYTMKQTGRMDVNLKNFSLKNALDYILKDLPVTYTIKDKNILIREKEKTISDKVKDFFANDDKQQQNRKISGKVLDKNGQALPGVNINIKGTSVRAITDQNGSYAIDIPEGSNTALIFSFMGFVTQEIAVSQQRNIDVELVESVSSLSEVVVVGYGTQKKSDITGSVASLSPKRLEGLPNTNLAQAIQGGIAGVSVQTGTAGAAPSESIMIRGRNSIKASNAPLVVIDGIAGNLNDVNPNDVLSVEVLKDASAAAIYGSRGSNGVILVTTKTGAEGSTKINYNSFYSVQKFIKIPDIMKGEDFYNFKKERFPSGITPSEQAIYDSGQSVDWLDLALRDGNSTQNTLSLSGGFKETKYYISGSFTDVTGLAVNDDYKKLSSRINVDTKFKNWLTVGTRTQLAYEDAAGIAPTWDGDQGVFWMNPLTTAFDQNGKQSIYPWPEETYFRNPLMGILATNVDENYQIVSNNFAVVDFPFLKGLQYRINTGIRLGFSNDATYYGRDTQRGFANRGDAATSRGLSKNIVLENILNYSQTIKKHSIFLTGVYSFENIRSATNRLNAQGFPNDFLKWYGASQAELVVPGYSNTETSLISAMGRINYSYDGRYLLTLTGRRDGYSGFGQKTKWGFFPSVAVGWNIANESFFNWKNIFNQLKLRASVGLNGNQAVSAYETISRLSIENMVSGSTTLPGYVPSKLGQDDLGWESVRTWNMGLDFGLLNNRISGDLNVFKSNTKNLLLDRTISPIHAVTSITQNIGETENRGFELAVTSRNIVSKSFLWETSGNVSFVKNKIVSLYGIKDANGKEIDDVANAWFIGSPIMVNYGYQWDGVWQLNEEEQAKIYKTQPGYIKIKDVSGPDGVPDGLISADYDRVIIGQRDPKYIWGLNNTFSYKNITLSVFIHGVHGVTKNNTLLNDAGVDRTVRMTTTKKNWWTPNNPTNDWYMNAIDANLQNGISAAPFEKAGFVRVRDISLSYDLAKDVFSRIGFRRCQFFMTGRNLFTITNFGGMDPELNGQRDIPMQKEYVFGINLDF